MAERDVGLPGCPFEPPVGDPVGQYDDFFADRPFGACEDPRSPPLHFGEQFQRKIGILRPHRFPGLFEQIEDR